MKFRLLLSIPIVLAACAKAPTLVPESALAPAVNAHAQIRSVYGPNILSGYTARPVQGPEDWRRLNNQQSSAAPEEN